MQTCPYCGLALVFDADHYYCTFCQMTIASADVQQDGGRKPITADPFVCADYVELSTPELMEKSTTFLIYLLRLVRKERKNQYNYLRLFNKVMDTGSNEYLEAAQESGKTYEWWTRKAWVIENILRDRMATFPVRVTDYYLSGLIDHIQTYNQKSMFLIRKGDRQQNASSVRPR